MVSLLHRATINKCLYVCRAGSECRWLRESHFQRDLQSDNIDADIVIEELQALHAEHTALT